MKRWDLINYLIEKFDYKTYLEIGVDNGACFNNIVIINKVSVDPAIDYPHARPTFKMTSDEFFVSNEKKFDIIFIDGLHHSDQVDKDIRNSINCLTDNGCILIHDSNPYSELAQRVPRESRYWTGDVWKSIVKYRATNNLPGCVVLDLRADEEGTAIIKNTIDSNFKLEIPESLTYEWLDYNRDNALGLISDYKSYLQNLQ